MNADFPPTFDTHSRRQRFWFDRNGLKDQLLKLDVLPALLAIFLIGFGADQVKNLLTRRPSETGAATGS